MSGKDAQFLEGLLKSDKQLQENKDVPALVKKYNAPASEASIDKTVKALNAKNIKTYVVAKADALKTVTGLIGKDVDVSTGGSQTIVQIGLDDWLAGEGAKANGNKYWKGEAGAFAAKGDWANYGATINKGMAAHTFITSASAVSEEGDIVWGSATGSRVSPWIPQRVVFVVGSNKIVPNYEAGIERLYKYCLTIESARARLAYKMPASSLADVGAVRGGGMNPDHFHVVIVKETLGF